MNNASLNQWLAYFASKQVINLGLERVYQVAKRLQLLEFACPIITVAGTNGKGSTVAMLESIYRHAGFTTATYTSPHLFQFNERIKFDNVAVDEERLCHAFAAVERARAPTELTYFEYATLAALYLFKQQDPDIIILEVGLGGRLDATNVVDSDCAIITSIGIDHTEYLGDTLEQIAYEKAGIMRTNKPVIYADVNMPKAIAKRAVEVNACLHRVGVDFQLNGQKNQTLKASNSAAAVKAVQLLHPEIEQEVINAGLRNVQILARCQWLNNNEIVDVAHNVDSIRYLASVIKQHQTKGRVLAVFSMLKDKAHKQCVELIADEIDEWHIAAIASERGANLALLQQAFTKKQQITSYDSLADAYKQAHSQLSTDDLLVVFGSFETVATIYSDCYTKLYSALGRVVWKSV